MFFGVADSWFVMPKMYGATVNWVANWQIFSLYLPQWRVTVPLFLAMSLAGILILSVYSIRNIQPGVNDHKEHAAIVATALGFTYQVIGAWPFWNQAYAWNWQQEIASYGNLRLRLFVGSLLAVLVGIVSLYKHSKFQTVNL